MREDQLPLHYTAAEETERVRPAVDSGDGGVLITLTHFSAAGSAPAASAVAVAPRPLPLPLDQYVADDPEPSTELEEARDSKSGTWLLALGVISVTTLFTSLYAICTPKWVPSFVAQTVKISKQLSADIQRASTSLGGTAVTDTAKAGAGTVAGAAGIHGAPTGRNSASAVQPKGGTPIYGVTRNSVVSGVLPAAPASLSNVDRSAAQQYGSSSGAHRTPASKAAEAKTSKSKKGLLVPPPPPTPCVLPPAFGSFPMQSAQQHAALQQQLQQAQAQAGNTPQQPTEASGRTEATQSAGLVSADQEFQAALNSSLRTVSKFRR